MYSYEIKVVHFTKNKYLNIFLKTTKTILMKLSKYSEKCFYRDLYKYFKYYIFLTFPVN